MSERRQRGWWHLFLLSAPARNPQPRQSVEATTVSKDFESRPRAMTDRVQSRGRSIVRAVTQVNWDVIWTVLTIKAILFVFGVAAYQVLFDRAFASPRELIEIWNRWDAPHYLDLARFGYQEEGEIGLFLVFFPMYPLLVRIAAFATGDFLVSALVVSTVASILAGLLLYSLVRLDGSDDLAQRAVWFLFIFPTSYFLHVGYTESVFLVFILGCMLTARKGQWAASGILGACAAFTRMNGALLLPALAVEAFQQYRTRDRWDPHILWIGVVGVGTLGYLALNYQVTGDPFRFLDIQQNHWVRTLAPPWEGIRNLHGYVTWRGGGQLQMLGAQELTFVTLGFAGAVASWLVLRPSYAVWMTLNWLLFVSNSFIASTPRYTITLFPLFIIFAALARNRIWYTALTTWSLLFLGLFTSQYVLGRWAF